MKKSEIRQTITGVIGGLITFAITLFLSMPIPLLIALPVGAYIGFYLASKPQLKIGSIKLKEANGEEMKQLMSDAFDDIQVLEAGSKISYDNEIKNLSEHLYQSGISIFEHLQENPGKIPLARRFINYYLETASSLISKYDKLHKSRVKGESISKAREDVINGLNILTNSFDKQFEHLMQGEIMDISTDVKVLTQTVKMEEGNV
ncbi:MAG: 5-bromo-4-chloroindolyl phosphate hydrolysis family protein [Saccharofermentanales bacterium]|jgi:5-bromo-4-chloroindolyl phosphate hydrolysis protein